MLELEMRENGTGGLLITFCGLDGSGKSTMMNMLSKELELSGKTVFITKQPTDSMRNSEMFRRFHDCREHDEYDYRALSLLCAADRLQHIKEVILPALKKYDVVLCDRYYYSCLANLRARGYCDDAWIYDIARNVTRPDVAFFFDIPVSVAIDRIRQREAERDRYIDVPLEFRLRDEYIDICRSNGGVLITTDREPQESFVKVKDTVEKVIDSKMKEKKGKRK